MQMMQPHQDFHEIFGLFKGFLGYLPDKVQWQTAIDDPVFQVTTIDIRELLNDVSSLHQIYLRVPTVGFVDVVHNFDTRAGFAVPISINGFIANQLGDIKAHVVAKDIIENQYPIVLNHKDSIEIDSGFTTLTSLDFIFDFNKLKDTIGLTLDQNYFGTFQLLLPLGLTEPYKIEIGLINSEGKEYAKKECFLYQTSHIDMDDIVIQNNNSNEDCASFYIKTNAHPLDTLRAVIQVDSGSQNWSSHIGLSESALKNIVDALIVKEKITDTVKSQFGVQDENINNFDAHPEAIGRVLTNLIDGVAKKTVPLVGMYKFFDENSLSSILAGVDTKSWDLHDKIVWQDFVNNAPSENFMDYLDGLFEPLYSTIKGDLPFGLDSVSSGHFSINISVESSNHDTVYQDAYQIQNLENYSVVDFTIDNMTIPDLSLNHNEAQNGKVFKISQFDTLKEADIIQDFDANHHDKIDLSHLLNNLHSASVEVHETLQGDTQIWVSHYPSAEHIAEKIHVATLIGVNSEKGNLPDDLTSFIHGGDLT